MMLVDPRVGSREFIGALKSRGVDAVLSNPALDSGDFAFEGEGEDGKILIGVERKTVRDLLSCLRTGRFAVTQLPGMVDAYQRRYLVVEGICRANPRDGILEEPHRQKGVLQWYPVRLGNQRFTHAELFKAILSFEEFAGVRPRFTADENQTVIFLTQLYQYWQKPYGRHRAHQGTPASHVEILHRWELDRCLAKELPGIGHSRSKDVAEQFPSIQVMFNAEVEEWLKIPGVGKVMAQRIVDAIRKRRR